jgi:hypothetical protein
LYRRPDLFHIWNSLSFLTSHISRTNFKYRDSVSLRTTLFAILPPQYRIHTHLDRYARRFALE